MSDIKNLIKLAVDAYRGKVQEYSTEQAQDALRQAMIELNGGSTKLNMKAIRDGKCNGLFSIVEEILRVTINDGLADDDFFNTLVDYRNLADGDENKFVVEEASLFIVEDVARGTQGIRRQRLTGLKEILVPTTTKMVRIYEELSRVLAGRVDFNHLIDVVAQSFKASILDDVYSVWAKMSGDAVYFPVAGTYSEDDLLDVIAHVEAAAGGKNAMLIGTKKALKPLMASIKGDNEKNNIDAQGYVGKFYGTPVMAVPQRHKVGTTTFAFSDKVISVVATEDKPIKVVNEGQSMIIMGNPLNNADLTQEYVYAENVGIAFVMAGNNGLGRYEMT